MRLLPSVIIERQIFQRADVLDHCVATNTQKIALVLGYQNRTANDGKHVDSFAGRAPGSLSSPDARGVIN
ncbi:MAG: hypothetical protein WBL98_12110 [Pseudolabrys sp.]